MAAMKFSSPMMPLPSTDKDRITRIQPDEFASVSLQSGKVTVRQRKPMAGSQHAQAFSQPWPELVATAQWQTLTIDDEGTYSYDPVSLQRVGDIVWGWVRFDMSPKALQNAREMAAKNTTGAPSLILERVYTFFLVDCRLQWIKPREIRIHMDGRLAAGSKYENADPTDWSRILSEDAGKSAVAQQMCEQQ